MADPENIERDKIKIAECPIVNVHGSLDEAPADGIVEKQQLVISTKSLPFEDWKNKNLHLLLNFYILTN